MPEGWRASPRGQRWPWKEGGTGGQRSILEVGGPSPEGRRAPARGEAGPRGQGSGGRSNAESAGRPQSVEGASRWRRAWPEGWMRPWGQRGSGGAEALARGLRRLHKAKWASEHQAVPAPGTPQEPPATSSPSPTASGTPPPRLRGRQGRGGLERRGGPEGQRAWPGVSGSSSGPSGRAITRHTLTPQRMLPCRPAFPPTGSLSCSQGPWSGSGP